ncbi:MAG: hypothetical protein WDO19_05320 [Bacteroidota bacterium]
MTQQEIKVEQKNKNSIQPLDIIYLSLALLFTVLTIRVKLYNLVDKEIIGARHKHPCIFNIINIVNSAIQGIAKKIVFMCWIIISLILLSMFFLAI